MERKIGETFEFDGQTYTVVKDHDIAEDCTSTSCAACDLQIFCNSHFPGSRYLKDIAGVCSHHNRTDNTDVHFELIEDVQFEPLFLVQPEYVPFDINLAKAGAKVVLAASHKEVNILKYDLKNPYPIVAIAPFGDNSEIVLTYDLDGKCNYSDSFYLMLEITKRVGYVAITSNGKCSDVYPTEELAKEHGSNVCKVLF